MAGLLSAPAGVLAQESGLVVNPKQIGGYVDIGQAFKDDFEEKQPMQRTGAYLTTSGVYNERLEVRATLGGLFWYAFPELTSPSRNLRFGPGVGEAQAIYRLGETPSATSSRIQFGLFPLKYNRDAANLGEYLYRSGTYPGYVATGGWSYLNSANFMMQGARLHLSTFGGRLTHDITLHMERDVAQPLHDFSPGYMVTAKPASFLEIGGGVVWSNAISFNSERLAREVEDNAYSKTTNMPVMGLTDFRISACSTPGQEAACFQDTAYSPDTTQARQTLSDWQDCEAGDCSNIGYYTFRGFKTMARVAVDVGVLLEHERILPGDFRIYSEIALLGVEDQPFYYEDRMERMPIMAGITLPTFGLIDRVSVEGEYRKSRFPNSFAYPFDNRGALPLPMSDLGPYEFSDTEVEENSSRYTKDDWKWSVYASHEVIEGVTVTAQAASDHMRPHSNLVNPPNEPFTKTPGEWYYVLRVNFGI